MRTQCEAEAEVEAEAELALRNRRKPHEIREPVLMTHRGASDRWADPILGPVRAIDFSLCQFRTWP
jgi:hypothetical protein